MKPRTAPVKRRQDAHIRIETHRDLFAVELLDTDHRSIARGYGTLEVDVPPGSYIARCEVGGPTVDKDIQAKSGEETPVKFSREEIYIMPSAAPVSGSVSRHEFFTYAASELALAEPYATLGSGSRLVLFASRYEIALQPNFETTPRPVGFEEVRLLDAAGHELPPFPATSSRTQQDVYYGRVGLAIDLDPGGYYLRWPSQGSPDDFLVQPLWMERGWTTFVFASALGESATPRPQTVSVHMTPLGAEVNPDDEETTAINALAELALASLRLRRRQLDDHALLQGVASPNFANPMLAILGCYMLLADEHRNVDLLEILSDRLHRWMPDHPDVRAIALLRRSTGEPLLEAQHFDFPPMLSQGLLGLDRLEWHQPTAMERREPLLQGTARLARLRALAESPWTTFWHGSISFTDAAPLIPLVPLIPGLRIADDRLTTIDRPSWASPRRSYGVDLLHSVGANASPFGQAEAEATVEANTSLMQYLEQLHSSTDESPTLPVKSQHLSWAGLAPPTAISTAAAMLAKR
jgi:hypothetical protein